MLELVYDILFNNKKIDTNKTKEQCIDYSENTIEFIYDNKIYIIKVSEYGG